MAYPQAAPLTGAGSVTGQSQGTKKAMFLLRKLLFLYSLSSNFQHAVFVHTVFRIFRTEGK